MRKTKETGRQLQNEKKSLKRRQFFRLGSLVAAITGAAATTAGTAASANAVPGDGADITTYVPTTEKGAALGVATLDTQSKIPFAQLPDLSATYARVFAVDALYADGVMDATSHIQSKIDMASAVGGGVVSIPPGQFRLTRSNDIASLLLLPNVVIRGSGPVTHLFLDPRTAPSPTRYHVLRIGTENSGADNVVVEDLKLTANHASIGGGSILGIGARHTGNKLASSNNITVRRCHIHDTQIAVCASKDGGDGLEEGQDRIKAQFRNWLVQDCVLTLCGNKMVEFSETNGARCVGNRMIRCYAGPQAIFFSQNIVFEKNYVSYTDSGLNIAAGAHDIDIVCNTFEADDAIHPSVSNGAIFLRTEPTVGRSYSIHNIRSRGNVYRDRHTRSRRVLKFQTRAENAEANYQLITFIGDIFDGSIYFDDVTSPAKTSITEFLFSDCTIEGDFFNDSSSTLASYTDNELRGCLMRKPGGYVLNASGWALVGNRIKSELTISAGATNNVIQANRIQGRLVDWGLGTVKANNVTG
ncbi:hypothetical protein Asphe3_30580 [Pseudarthrobacter phenanthrenivorans Sphe3]|uniref:Pectate lyase superfamily protein domain-containing protein n=1 Tax=Pseudarthrobacter phenanthrenivorans (strain DSM 18606 / JCM 16027 / LMG 23796 / Sphe3) TaxID=930171 RepID=F0M1H2_PSEPM|nr:hypothetical protein [Pseudarthrobacter phenanthrenivorans]ADX74168.1 hypothetical protein Asphe3_30580 [Pseudarthrobacter phenanthrenivorans Sphe3]